MNLSIESKSADACHMAHTGRLTYHNVNGHGDELAKLLGEANYHSKVLLSLKHTDFIDSSGIGWLLEVDKKIRNAGGKLVLHSIPTEIQNVFGLMNLSKVLKLAKDKQHAFEIAEGEQHDG